MRARGAEANHILVLIDGARANDPATGDEFRWEFLTTANIERIEIVRGPQSAIWGSDALAGVVNIITRSGGAEHRREARRSPEKRTGKRPRNRLTDGTLSARVLFPCARKDQ